MTGDHIQDIFNDYLKAENTQYTIMINGSWGSGKTHFWKEKLHPLVLSKNLKPIYISLNGISKIEGLEYQMLLGLMPYISNSENKVIKSSTKFIGNAANAVTKFFTRSSSFSDIFKGVVIDNLNYSGKILCFDDLERCQMPIEEVLGFINNFIEHKSLKAIFLADEKKLENEKYHKAKEKIIRHTLNFAPSLTELVPQLAIKFNTNDPEFYNFLTNRLQLFTAILEEYEENNLRNISFILDCLQRLFPAFKTVKEEFQMEIILFTIIISIELKTGQIRSTDYQDSKDLDKIDYSFYQILQAKRSNKPDKDKSQVETYPETICDKYLSNRLEQYCYYNSIYIFILTGYLDGNKYKTELEERNKSVISQEVIDFRTITSYNFRTLSQADFNRLAATVWSNALNGQYSIYDYINLANFYYFFSKNNLVKETQDEIKKRLTEGLNIAKQRFETDNYQMSNHLAFESEELTEEFKMIVNNVHIEVNKNKDKHIGHQLVAALSSNDLNTLKAVMNKISAKNKVFGATEKQSLFKAIIGAENIILFNFIRQLTERYHFLNTDGLLNEEKECISYLISEIEKYLDNSNQDEQIKKLMLKELLKELSIISRALQHPVANPFM